MLAQICKLVIQQGRVVKPDKNTNFHKNTSHN